MQSSKEEADEAEDAEEAEALASGAKYYVGRSFGPELDSREDEPFIQEAEAVESSVVVSARREGKREPERERE